MAELILRAEPRTVLGKQVKALRRAGKLPGIVYGPVMDETVPVSVNTRELSRFYQNFGTSTLFTLQWDGGSQPVFIREVQVDPVRFTPLHVDFFAPNLRIETTATVSVTVGETNPDAQGMLNVLHNEVSVRGLPTDIPPEINVDISQLVEIGDAVRVSDVSLPQGISIELDDEEIIVTLISEAAPSADDSDVDAVESPAEVDAAESPANAEAEEDEN